jgi:hypothetical protein
LHTCHEPVHEIQIAVCILRSPPRGSAQARKRRLEQERAFYRNLNAYCRANNLSTICEDDWKTAAHDKN